MNGGYELVLVHHGVKGQRWGIRRTSEQLGHKVAKLEKRNKWLKSKLNDKKEHYQQKRIMKADKLLMKSAKLERRSMRYMKKSKPGLLRSKRSAYNNYLKGSKLGERSQKLRIKGTMMRSKASKYVARQAQYKIKIERNERLMNTFRSTAKALDQGAIKQGKFFMQYVD